MKARIQLSRGLEAFFGTRDENIRLLESSLGVSTRLTPDALEIDGPDEAASRAERIVLDYLELAEAGQNLSAADVNSLLRIVAADEGASLRGLVESGRARNFGKKSVVPKTLNQRTYLDTIERLDLTFGIGPAGTGKTYLAVAMAVSALLNKQVDRIILTRPAVEAGERLGFLPGTLQEKIDPYLRPLYDALFDMLDGDRVEKALERNLIEIAPLAFMRGRTLNNAFIILDEAQNSTAEQMKMMLTRIGNNSKLVVTGDLTQIDLPLPKRCGLQDALDVLRGVGGIGFVFFDGRDVVRNRLVQRIVEAYERFGELAGTARQMALPIAGEDEPAAPGPRT
jgi:phosphate starvation-inducible protein PhoH and related proteins